MTVEINLAAVADEQASLEMIAGTDKAGSIIARAGQVTAAGREQISAWPRSGHPAGNLRLGRSRKS